MSQFRFDIFLEGLVSTGVDAESGALFSPNPPVDLVGQIEEGAGAAACGLDGDFEIVSPKTHQGAVIPPGGFFSDEGLGRPGKILAGIAFPGVAHDGDEVEMPVRVARLDPVARGIPISETDRIHQGGRFIHGIPGNRPEAGKQCQSQDEIIPVLAIEKEGRHGGA